MIPSSNIHYQKTDIDWNDSNSATKENSWNVTRFFTKGDLIKVEITPAIDWSNQFDAPTPEVPYPSKGVFVNITDPLGQMTEYFCTFVQQQANSHTLFLYDLEITESHGLLVGSNSSIPKKYGITGEVMTSGNHTAWVWAVLPGGKQSAPSAIIFLKGKRTTSVEYPYSYFVYVGIAAIPLGTTLMIYGFKKRKKVRYGEEKVKKSRISKNYVCAG